MTLNPTGAFTFLINFAIELYAMIVLTRFLLQAVKADFYNPISQFVTRATDPLLKPLRRILPHSGSIDYASLLLFLIIVGLKILLLLQIGFGVTPGAGLLLGLALKTAIGMILSFFTFAIFISIILSWVNPDPYNPIVMILHQLTEPLLGPARKLLPPMGGIDFSPMIVLVLLYGIKIFLNIP